MTTVEEIVHKIIAPRSFAYSVKLESTAKGYIQPSVTVNSDDGDCWLKAARLLSNLIDECKVEGWKMATDIKEQGENGGNSNTR